MHQIQVLGIHCPRCERLHAHAIEAARACPVPCTVRKIANILEVVEYDPCCLPALAIDGRVVSAGRVLSAAEIGELLAAACHQPAGTP